MWYCMPNLAFNGLVHQAVKSAPYDSLENLLADVTGCEYECHQLANDIYEECSHLVPDNTGMVRIIRNGMIIVLYDKEKDDDLLANL